MSEHVKVAKAVVRTEELHNASYITHEDWYKDYYSRDWHDCATQSCDELGLDPQWIDLVSFLTHGYCEGYDWAEANAKG